MGSLWLLKTEAGEWGWEHQANNGGVSHWDGVRNAQAQKHLRSMQRGDLALFYHSGGKRPPAVVGVVEVVKTAYPDVSDASGKSCMVDVRALKALPNPVPLSLLKTEECMRDWVLVRQPRLSVMPVSPCVWNRVCELGELSPPPSLPSAAAAIPEIQDCAPSKLEQVELKKTGRRKANPALVQIQAEALPLAVEEELQTTTAKNKKKKGARGRDSVDDAEKVYQKRARQPPPTRSVVALPQADEQNEQSESVSVVVKTYQRDSRRRTTTRMVSEVAQTAPKKQNPRSVRKHA